MFKGSRIREQRKIAGLSQENLADKIGTHVNTIRRWEKDKQAPDINSLIQVADVLHTTVAYLSGETNEAVLQEGITPSNPAPDNESMHEKRLIIRNNDMYVNLPETPEGFDALRRFLNIQEEKSSADVIHTLAQA